MTAPTSDLAARRLKNNARSRMSLLAGHHERLRADTVAIADARTSMHDARVAFNVACGTDLADIDRNGYTIRGGAR